METTTTTTTPADPPARAVKKPRSWKRRILVGLVRIAVGTYIGLALVLSLFQTSLIFPGAATQGRRDAVVRPFQGGEVLSLKAKTGDTVAALFGGAMTPDGSPHPDGKHRPTLLYFYGNGMCMADCEGEFLKFRHRGFNVLVAEYVGYGMSTGKPSEQGVYATADACYDHLRTRDDVDPKKIVPVGWSLGSAAAIHVASVHPDVPAIVCVSAFTSMADMAATVFPYMPAKLILKHHFENELKVRQLRVPIFLAHGTRDRIIPFAMAGRLASAAGGRVVRYNVDGGDHNDVFDVGGTGLLDAIEQFVNDAAR